MKKLANQIRSIIRLLLLFAFLALAWFSYEYLLPRTSFSGTAEVIDGDTIAINNTRVRLYGIDAPEAAQKCENKNGEKYFCGRDATIALNSLIGENQVSCAKRDMDQYGRTVATCEVAQKDIGYHMVRNGQAVAYTYYSWRYIPAQIEAFLYEKGIWEGDFMNPYDWRRSN